ncbi:MAG: branched-chain amino acid ABC transporter permease [Rhodobacteraceae bacterium]|nr:MAG: branched-chain amino acid ABC transporter permease [Paracoccaceae bacterium]
MTLAAETPAPARAAPPLGAVAVVAALALAPLAFDAAGAGFWIVVLSRGLVYAVAAMALQLVLGRGGLVCFGFAAFLVIGAYAVGIPYHHRVEEGLVVLPLAMAAAALFALATGAIALRTRGVYFIMITLAFGQMVYYALTALSTYGGDDGMTLWGRSQVAGFDLFRDRRAFYWLCLGAAAGTWALVRAVSRSHFGRVLEGARQNEARMAALGFDVFRVRLIAYALSGALGGLAGALLANHAEFVSPAYGSWHVSGELIVMVVLGGFASVTGAGFGAILLAVLEEVLSRLTSHWKILLGLGVVGVALLARDGLAGALARWRGR